MKNLINLILAKVMIWLGAFFLFAKNSKIISGIWFVIMTIIVFYWAVKIVLDPFKWIISLW